MSALDTALQGLQYVGDSLDKLGSRQLRGVLGGHYDELKSVIPFSDSLGITDPSRIVSGRDLTDQAGITTKGDNSFHSHALGFAADMLLDPKNLMGFGAAKAAPALAHWAEGTKAAAPVAESIGAKLARFAQGESGALNWEPFERNLLRNNKVNAARQFANLGPADYFASLGQDINKLPVTALDKLGEHFGIPTLMGPEFPEKGAAYLHSLEQSPSSSAFYAPLTSRLFTHAPMDGSLNPDGLSKFFQSHPAMSIYKTPAHEAIHAAHDLLARGLNGASGLDLNPIQKEVLSKLVSPYSATNAGEAVAEMGAHAIVKGSAMPKDGDLGQILKAANGPSEEQISGIRKILSPFLDWEKAGGNLTKFIRDDSGSLRIPIKGVSPEVADLFDKVGPRYPGGIDKIRELIDQFDGVYPSRIGDILDSPYAEHVAGELPPGLRLLGSGVQADAFATPEGHVIRLQNLEPKGNQFNWTPPYRPNYEGMLQSIREAQHGPFNVEHLPAIKPMDSLLDTERQIDGLTDSYLDNFLSGHARAAGLRMHDLHTGNYGLTPEGKVIVFDPGTIGDPAGITPHVGIPGGISSRHIGHANDLVGHSEILGGPRAVQDSINQALQEGTKNQGLSVPFPDYFDERYADRLLKRLKNLGIDLVRDDSGTAKIPMASGNYSGLRKLRKDFTVAKNIDMPEVNPFNLKEIKVPASEINFKAPAAERYALTEIARIKKQRDMLGDVPPGIKFVGGEPSLDHETLQSLWRFATNHEEYDKILGNYSSGAKMATVRSPQNLLRSAGIENPTPIQQAIARAESKETERHEIIHGLIDAASEDPRLRKTAPMAIKIPAWFKAGQEGGLREAAGSILDELAAQSLEHRKPSDQLGSALQFLFGKSRKHYIDTMDANGKLAGTLYRALPALALGGGIGTVAGAGALLNGVQRK